MIDPLPCPTCAFANAPGAEHCTQCGTALADTPERVHPGETLRDPDDLTLPPSPLLRAVLRGEPEAFATDTRTPAAATTTAPATTQDAPPATRVAPETTAVSPTPPPAEGPAPSASPPLTRASVEQLSGSADHAALLRDLAERLHARRAEPTVHYAGFVVRTVAFVVDGIVLTVFGVPLAAAGYWGMRAGLLALGHGGTIEPDEGTMTLLLLGWFVMATAYFTVLHTRHGQTIGKALVGIAVRTLHLHQLGFGRAFVRTLAYAISSSFFGFGFLLVALTPRKRGWHDFVAGTCVVRLAPDEASA